MDEGTPDAPAASPCSKAQHCTTPTTAPRTCDVPRAHSCACSLTRCPLPPVCCLLLQATSVMVHGRPLSDDRIRDIAVSCLHGLMFLHRRGVCVRDIKPENLLVRSPGGEVVLADMGHATRSDSSGRLQQQGWEGSVPYIAPEAAPRVLCQQPQQSGSRLPPGCQRVGGAKAAKRPVLTTKVDVYALGKSLYRCAGWGCPLKNWEAGISAELRQFLDHLMEPNAAKRPTASRALEHPFLQQQQQQA